MEKQEEEQLKEKKKGQIRNFNSCGISEQRREILRARPIEFFKEALDAQPDDEERYLLFPIEPFSRIEEFQKDCERGLELNPNYA